MTIFAPASTPRLVVKVGSALLVDPDGSVRRDWLATLVADGAERVGVGCQHDTPVRRLGVGPS